MTVAYDLQVLENNDWVDLININQGYAALVLSSTHTTRELSWPLPYRAEPQRLSRRAGTAIYASGGYFEALGVMPVRAARSPPRTTAGEAG